ncbi:hypothetical protein Phum_PHUM232010 [Pediculus humanus corporis]|uniref:Protein quiver n=1 Tax=Pediculus humanus subsp. corporis TaxID=121224 RepID=E0VIS1_PEDHC|nr:uncharacterized protein Phum_PHUM232010 [Pediculus humanus corporis]EEB13277.1 hypothetical protein Phum_PHUM232010 [Pediculus humanus corporis]
MSVVRGCYYDNMDGRDLCTMLRSKIVDQSNLPFCETCTGDSCNGSSRMFGSTTNTLLFITLLPMIAYYFNTHKL